MTYREQMFYDVKRGLDELLENCDCSNCEDMTEELYDYCFDSDSVTGNGSGSYFCSASKAREFFNSDKNATVYLERAVLEGIITEEEIGKHFIKNDYEWLDVIVRLALLYDICAYVIETYYD